VLAPLSQCGNERKRGCYGVREAARARRLPVGAGLAATGRRSGVTAESGSTPRAAASTAPAVGSRKAAATYARGKGQGSTWPPRDRYARALGCASASVGLAERCARAQVRTRTVRLGVAPRARQASHGGTTTQDS
jgi:hypothetical protein